MKNTILFLVCISKIQKSSENQKIFCISYVEITLTELMGD